MFGPGERVGLAVSGGADSVALFMLLEELRNKLGISLCVLHFNHQLRREADADEAFVKELALKHSLPFHSARCDVAAEAKRHGWNLEDAGRRLRYQFFAEVAREAGATKIATAHTADDQAETVLARIIRGSGIKGLGSIQPKMRFVVRPLLEVRRRELRDYLAKRRQSWREDASNQDLRQLRARLRHQLLPQLEKDFSPAIIERLCSISDLARSEDAFWSAFIQERFGKLVEKSSSGYSICAMGLLAPLDNFSGQVEEKGNPAVVVTQKLIRHIHSRLAEGEGQLSRKDVDQVIWLAAKGQSGRRLELPGGVGITREFNKLVFRPGAVRDRSLAARRISAAFPSYEYEVRLPSLGSATVSIPELGRSLCLKLVDWPWRQRDTTYDNCVLDAERLSFPLVIRNWRPGDAYRPVGHKQPRKLKQMFLAGRVAVTERSLWPVLTSAGRVAWARRMPVAAEFSAGDDTRIGLQISDVD